MAGIPKDILGCTKPLSQWFRHVLGMRAKSCKENPPPTPQTPITLVPASD